MLRRDGAVTVICAHRANLEHLPEALGELSALERLDLGHNRLSELPALPASLRELYVHDNQLVQLPALPALKVLDARLASGVAVFIIAGGTFTPGCNLTFWLASWASSSARLVLAHSEINSQAGLIGRRLVVGMAPPVIAIRW